MKTTCDWHSDLVNCFRKDITAKKIIAQSIAQMFIYFVALETMF